MSILTLFSHKFYWLIPLSSWLTRSGCENSRLRSRKSTTSKGNKQGFKHATNWHLWMPHSWEWTFSSVDRSLSAFTVFINTMIACVRGPEIRLLRCPSPEAHARWAQWPIRPRTTTPCISARRHQRYRNLCAGRSTTALRNASFNI